ncbi:MAG TPA: hypothetical protein VI391_00030, partial [Thermoanaerobaculia bacterium]
MIKSRKLQALFTGTAAVMMLTGTSAFAESRHRAETRNDSQQQTQTQQQVDRSQARGQEQSGRTWDRSQAPSQNYQRYDRSQTQNNNQRYDRSQSRDDQRYDRSQSQNYQRYDRSQSQNYQRYDRSQTRDDQRYDRSQTYNNDRSRSEAHRYDNRSSRSYSLNRGEAWHGSYGRAPVAHERRFYAGRVDRYEPYRGGFRVWIGGAPYPFFVGADLFRHFGIRIGAVLSLGGYWDPLGYYNVYNVGPYAYSQGDLRGVVENVDYYRRTVVVRDDVSGAFVTGSLRGGDPRLGSLRPGDYVDLTGAWDRAGYFNAYNLADFRPGDGG